MKTNVKMICENCGTENSVAIDQLLVSNFKEGIKKDLESELQKRENALSLKKKEHDALVAQIAREREDIDLMVNQKVKSIILEKEEKLKATIRKEINDEKILQLETLEKELEKKSTQLRELNRTKADLERLRRDYEEAETRIVLQKEKELSERLELARTTIKEQVQQETFLKIKEREKVIEDLSRKLDEAKRKAEQGSMQLQGEIQELEIIELLSEMHPYDSITQSKKGANAADILQVVRTKEGLDCGSIYYESKRTASWSNDWIKKFKQDNLNTKADILILVTNAMPKSIQRYGIIDGVWITSFNHVKELSLALRYGLLKLKSVAITQQGKSSKMELLYNYLTSEEFFSVFSSIMEGYKAIQESHHQEKLKIQKLWVQREKQIEQVLANSIEMYGSIKGIAGNSINEIQMLEFLPKAG